MKVIEFAKAIGMSETFVRNKIKSNELPIKITKKQSITVYDIDENLIGEWKEKVNAVKRKRPFNPVSTYTFIKHRQTKRSSLNETIKKLNAYNKKHGTNYSYGEATSKGII